MCEHDTFKLAKYFFYLKSMRQDISNLLEINTHLPKLWRKKNLLTTFEEKMTSLHRILWEVA